MSRLAVLLDFSGAPVDPVLLRRLMPTPATAETQALGLRLLKDSGFAMLASVGEGASQPLESRDGTVCLVADARFDNRSDLLAVLELERSPGDEEEPSDVALLLAAYRRWGINCPEYLLGDFAFALWDIRERRLLCARDPLGSKLLHYARLGPLLCVASEARQVLRHPSVPRDVDEISIADYLSSVVDDPGHTFFRCVHPVPPAHRLIATASEMRIDRFWDIDPDRRLPYRRRSEYADHLRDLMRQATVDRLRGCGRTVGLALSGGLDSSSIAALVQTSPMAQQGGLQLVGASCVFDRLHNCDERLYIEETSRKLGFSVEHIDAEHLWFLSDDEAFRPSLETPFLGWEACVRNMLARLRQHGARVLLTGHAGDDLVAGSRLVYAQRLARGDARALWEILRYAQAGRIPLARLLYRYFGQPLLPPAVDRALRRLTLRRPRPWIPDWISPELVRRTSLRERLSASPPHPRFRDSARQEVYERLVGHPGHLRAVSWYDRIAAPFGMEVRHPYLDQRLVEFVLAVPPVELFVAGRYKSLLRDAMTGLIPEVILERRDKTSFRSFRELALREKEATRIESLLTRPLAAELGFVEGHRLKRAFQAYKNGSSDPAYLFLGYAITLELWLRQYYPGFEENAEISGEERPAA